MLSTGHPVLRRSTEVSCGQMRSMTFANFFRVLLFSKVIWGAYFESDIHFTLRWLEIRSWDHRVVKGQRCLNANYFFSRFFDPLHHLWAFQKHIETYSTRREEYPGRWNFALAPPEAKLLTITGFSHFSALHLTSEVTGWPRTVTTKIKKRNVIFRAILSNITACTKMSHFEK